MKKAITIFLAILVIVLMVVLNFSIWSYINNPLQLKPWTKTTMGVTFDPRRKDESPNNGKEPSVADIDSDLALLENKVYAVRTYTVGGNYDKIPELAEKHHLNVAVGAWIGADLNYNRQELDRLYATLQKNTKNIVRIFVGNEVLLRKDTTERQLIDYIREVKQFDDRPVSTSETFETWLTHPELVKEVDFIAVHLLPYWEGISADDAPDAMFNEYAELQRAYPDKSIIISEVGWPSDGQPFEKAMPSRANQAEFLRAVIQRAEKDNISYYIVEAFDQPWKVSIEGSVGAYWGLFDSDRHAKYPFNSNMLTVPDWKHWAVDASMVSAALMILLWLTRRSIKLPGLLFLGVITNLAASTIFWTVSVGANRYQTKLSLFLWGLMLLVQGLAALILIVESLEIVEVIWHRKTKRSFELLTPPENFRFPKVSLHLPIYNEPPDMVRETLNALALLDYPNLEVLVIDNNTKDPAVWQPVKADCERLGSRFRFFHLDNWPGFKAGALNYALQQTAKDAEIIGVIDSDYKVAPQWLKSMVPYFDNAQVAFVQSPQDYRDGVDSVFKTSCYWEYAGFFNIGMVQRNEHNAIIQHGTMTLIRKLAFDNVGPWAEWCITEDSELGLRLYEAGYDSVYVNHSLGQGLMPDSFAGYRGQRFRWVYGAMQMLKKHWRSFLPTRKSPLTAAQRYYFIAGWLPWFSDALALLFTLTTLLLTAILLYDPVHSELPTRAFLFPTLGLFSFKILRGLWLYRARVPCTIKQILGAFLAGLSLTHTVARAIWWGLLTRKQPFLRTPKHENRSALWLALMGIRQELLILVALIAAVIAMTRIEHFDNLIGKLWVTILVVQAVPYLATLVFTWMSVWRNKKK